MAFVLTLDAQEFNDRAGDFLADQMECNVLATVLMNALAGRYRNVRSVFGYQLAAGGAVTGAVMRTPPHALLASPVAADEIEPLLDAWLRLDPDLNGVNGPPETARSLTQAWVARTGGRAGLAREMAMHSLRRVARPPRPAAGRLRLGRPRERELLIDWWQAFVEQAGGHGGGEAAANVEARLANGSLFVWDQGGPVSLVAMSPPVDGVVRIGPVYTPPEQRRHGYAGTAVAEVSRRALAAGARACMLLTDLANPTSNKIYAEVGFQRFADWEEYEFRSD
ncbi:MAG: GNAT family N-acetyltransferase [Solirubrobacteraceae bacterium]